MLIRPGGRAHLKGWDFFTREAGVDALQAVLFAVGLALLLAGAELLVRGATGLAMSLGVPPLVVGLTVVSLGTTAPELAVSTQSAAAGQAELALGNVVGSNIFNVLFLLGASALVAPLRVDRLVVRREVPLLLGLSVLVWLLSLGGAVSRWEGLLLMVGALIYTAWTVRAGRRASAAAQRDLARELAPLRHSPVWLDVALFLGGLGMLVLGSRWLVGGAVALARALGVSELLIGLTLLAGGTSLPEVATAIVASLRGERALAVGNALGACIFNLLLVLGLAAVVAPGGVPVPAAALSFDLPVMVAVALACLPVFLSGYVLSRWKGAVFLAYYVAYTAYLVLDTKQHDALRGFTQVMGGFVLPLTALTLVALLVRGTRRPRAA